ncbi:head GIN domain-containing protein [Iodobacter sp. CM08]|uniref:head GIN domain-containing protein n=1 Tax=Iodobacter sp. CM08 TaxID=3085902 RepID=UPI0029824020|nr:head GIN domain-containing protein [Iodobacter sp. CM08]MDW5417970.1 head GIN domain-containing protein [Iodobacter sp. CM08]
MKRLLPALVLVICTIQLNPAYAFSLFTKTIQGSGHIEKQTRMLPAFNRIESETTGRVEIIQGNQESITIESDDNIIPAIETVVENGGLKIRHKRIDLNTKTLNIIVRVKELRSINLAGSGSIYAKPLTAKKLIINTAGSGTVELSKLDVSNVSVNLGGSGSVQVQELQSSDLDVSLGGSGSFKSAGNVNILTISMGGSGQVDTMQLKAKIVKLSMAGSGQVIVAAKEQLSASVAGSGDIQYYGDPQTHLSMMGSATLKRIGAFPI